MAEDGPDSFAPHGCFAEKLSTPHNCGTEVPSNGPVNLQIEHVGSGKPGHGVIIERWVGLAVLGQAKGLRPCGFENSVLAHSANFPTLGIKDVFPNAPATFKAHIAPRSLVRRSEALTMGNMKKKRMGQT